MALPSGVAIVFSDIEGSTKLWESDPDGMRASLARHDEIVRSVVEPGLVYVGWRASPIRICLRQQGTLASSRRA